MTAAQFTRREWLIAFAVALLLTGLLQIPYALGYALARPGVEFTGVIMNPEDSQSYLAKMLQGYDGNWLYTIPFTSEEHEPAFIGGFYLALGQLSRWLGLSLIAMWHLARIVADLVLFLVTFGFIATFLREARLRWTAYLLAILGSGAGWLLLLFNQPDWLGAFPVDFKMPEAHLFFSALTFPHVALGTALVLASFWLTLSAASPAGGWRAAIGAGVMNLLVCIDFPFLIYLVVPVIGLYLLLLMVEARRVLWSAGLKVALSFLIPSPLLLYYANTLATNAVFRAWDAQAVTLSPPWPHYLVAYGPLLLLGLLSLAGQTRLSSNGRVFLWTWIATAAVLVYSPSTQQRRFVEGVQIPLAILATVGLFDMVLPWVERRAWFKRLASSPRYSTEGLVRFLIVAFLFVMSLSNVYVFVSESVTVGWVQLYPLFRAHSEIVAVDWLRNHTARADVVLSAYETGNYIAAHAGNRVVVGHWTETVDWGKKMEQVGRFYGQAGDAERRELLTRYTVRYVWLGQRERDLGDFSAGTVAYLQPVYSNAAVSIYRVVNR